MQFEFLEFINSFKTVKPIDFAFSNFGSTFNSIRQVIWIDKIIIIALNALTRNLLEVLFISSQSNQYSNQKSNGKKQISKKDKGPPPLQNPIDISSLPLIKSLNLIDVKCVFH